MYLIGAAICFYEKVNKIVPDDAKDAIKQQNAFQTLDELQWTRKPFFTNNEQKNLSKSA